MARKTILSADIGGTNSRFLLHEVGDGGLRLVLNRKYLNKDFGTFKDVMRQFLSDAGVQATDPPSTACLAFAGPVTENRAKLTNRDGWNIFGDELAAEFSIKRVKIVNDFLAVGYGLLTLNEAVDCVTLQAAPKQPGSPIACIGSGTGLGECFLTMNNGSYQCYPSEGGHAEFAPRNDTEIGLLEYLKKKFSQKHRISVERIVSGHGLANIYEYLCHAHPDKVDPAVAREIEEAGDMKGAVIAAHKEDPLCVQTMSIFITAYGAEAGVAGLKWLPYGGLYLTGGMTPKNIDLIREPNGPFMHALLDKGRVSGMLHSIPIYAVMVDDLGERGAQFLASKMLQELNENKGSSGEVCAAQSNCDCRVLKQLFWVGLCSTGLLYLSSLVK